MIRLFRAGVYVIFARTIENKFFIPISVYKQAPGRAALDIEER